MADALGHPIDRGIVQAVAMLNELGINTSASCEGHANWATGGPYIDIVSKGYRALKIAHGKAMSDPAELEEDTDRMREEMRLANVVEGKKILPVLDAFYKKRSTDYEVRIGFFFYGAGITRLQSVGVAFF